MAIVRGCGAEAVGMTAVLHRGADRDQEKDEGDEAMKHGPPWGGRVVEGCRAPGSVSVAAKDRRQAHVGVTPHPKRITMSVTGRPRSGEGDAPATESHRIVERAAKLGLLLARLVLGGVLPLEGLLRIISVSGLIGFVTNWVAITMLFNPRQDRPGLRRADARRAAAAPLPLGLRRGRRLAAG